MRLEHRVKRRMVWCRNTEALSFANNMAREAFDLQRAAFGDVMIHRSIHARRKALEARQPDIFNVRWQIRAGGPCDRSRLRQQRCGDIQYIRIGVKRAGFGLAKYAPERFTSLSLGGTHPYAEDMQAVRDRLPRDLEAFIAMAERAYGRYMTSTLRARLLESDLDALLAMTQDRHDVSDILPQMAVPCLPFAGDADPKLPLIHECVKHLANATFFSLQGCDHAVASARSDLIVPQVKAFLRAFSR
jgi:pimeloyl-ACP methyl ester carboxylesterase